MKIPFFQIDAFTSRLFAGNPAGVCSVPPDAQLEDVSNPHTVVGNGTAASCTSDAVVSAIAAGGVVTFSCGPDPIVIPLSQTATLYVDAVIDGGGKVALSGAGVRRIIYMNPCAGPVDCTKSALPRLTLQNIDFVDGNAKGEVQAGGGAVLVHFGRLKVVNARFFDNVSDLGGPDVAGGAIYVTQDPTVGQPGQTYVVNSTFGGTTALGNKSSNGGAIGSVGASWTIINSILSNNSAVGSGGNPPVQGSPGGGSGGAIYNDGNTMTLSLCGVRVEDNAVNSYGSAIYFVTEDHSGNIVIDQSTILFNTGGSWYPTYPQISAFADTPIAVTSSIIQ